MFTISCTADEVNHSLIATKYDPLFYHSFDMPSCAVECSSPDCFIVFLILNELKCFTCPIRISNLATLKSSELLGQAYNVRFEIKNSQPNGYNCFIRITNPATLKASALLGHGSRV